MPYSTITEALIDRARHAAQRDAYTVIDPMGTTSRLTYGELLSRSLAVAAELRERGLRQGERILIGLPTSEALLVTLWGVVLAGGVCVPVYPPLAVRGVGRWKQQIRTVARVVQPRGAVVQTEARAHMAAVLEEHGEDLFTVTSADLRDQARAEPANVLSGDLAFVQFTSGTTRLPRGVAITHAALLANAQALVAGLQLGTEDVSVSWLPPYHDMGLVGHVFTPVLCGAHQVLMAPTRFLVRPARWLRLLTDVGATQTTAPNTAYSICVRRIAGHLREDLDLSRVRSALCGAEPVQHETHRRFCEDFAAAGFSREAFRPVYGLAEATLAVSLGPLGGAQFDWVDRRLLGSFGRAEPARPAGVDSVAFACVGQPVDGHEVSVQRSDGAACAERQVGEILFRGPSVMQGYFNDPMATRQVLRDGWLRTGDLGYVADRQLYVTGRAKELIIKAGRNYLPVDIEEACLDEPRLRAGRAVAFGLNNAETGTEDLVIVAEVRDAAWTADRQLAQRITGRVAERTGVRPDRVELVEPGLLPKTTSGKLQRNRVRDAFEAGRGLSPPGRRMLEGAWQRVLSLALLARVRARRALGWQ